MTTDINIIDRVAGSPAAATTLELVVVYERMLSDLGRLTSDSGRADLIDEIRRRAHHGDKTAIEYWTLR